MVDKTELDIYTLIFRISEPLNLLGFVEKTVFSKKKLDINDTILISGSPRSGTTWLMDILENIPSYTWIFEPIQPAWFPESFKVGFNSRTYLPEEKDWKEGENFLKKVFTGKVYSTLPPYSFKLKENMNRVLGNKLIVKTVRLNRMLPWINKRFNLRKILLIIRHPCAVIASQLKSGFVGYHPNSPPYYNILPTKKDVLDEASKIEILDEEIIKKLEKINTTEEILAATWCIDNFIPLNSKKPYHWDLIFYEKLVREGDEIIKEIFTDIKDKKIIESMISNLEKPSRLASEKLETYIKTDKQLSKWKKHISEEKVKKILDVVSIFGLDFYTDSPVPDYDKFKSKFGF